MSRRLLSTALVLGTFAMVLTSIGPARGITGARPVVVALCNFSDQRQEPKAPSYYEEMFSDKGAGKLGALDYWRDVSYGAFSVSGTVVKGWYTLPITRDTWNSYGRRDKWYSCAEAVERDVDLTKYAGVIAVHPNAYGTLDAGISATATSLTLASTSDAAANFPTPPFKATLSNGNAAEVIKVTAVNGATFTVERKQDGSTASQFPTGSTLSVGNDLFGFNPTGIAFGLSPYILGGMVMSHDHPLSLALHEEAHLFGLYAPLGTGSHSRTVSRWPGQEYCDRYDLGSADCTFNFSDVENFGSKGTGFAKPPGLNAVQLDALGWLPPARIATFDNSSCRQATFTMAALNHPEKAGFQEIRVPASGTFPGNGNMPIATDYYTVEMRSRSGWDRGIPADAFVLHLKGSDGASYLVDRDRTGLPVGTPGQPGEPGALRPTSPSNPGRRYVDQDKNVYLAVNSLDAANATGVITVGGCKINASLTYSGDTAAVYHRQATLAGDLVVAGTTAPVPNASVTFTLGSQSCSGTTDASGHASCAITVNQPPGSHSVQGSFAGDVVYNAASKSSTFTVSRAPTTLTYTGPTVILQGAAGVTLTAVLLEEGLRPPNPSGQTVTLGLGSQTCTATVAASGLGSCNVVFSGPVGDEPLSATFAGDAYYLPSSDTGKTATVFAFPSRGAFVLGDATVAGAGTTTNVTWWSDDWSSLNTLTGGIAPDSFKGFGGQVTTLPTSSPVTVCGQTFRTLPGSSPPPPSDVPSYMGVLVADSVTKNGNAINGSWTSIVVVRTTPGYAPNAGHAGTGTIVARFC